MEPKQLADGKKTMKKTVAKLKLTMPLEVDAIRNDLIVKIKARAESIRKWS